MNNVTVNLLEIWVLSYLYWANRPCKAGEIRNWIQAEIEESGFVPVAKPLTITSVHRALQRFDGLKLVERSVEPYHERKHPGAPRICFRLTILGEDRFRDGIGRLKALLVRIIAKPKIKKQNEGAKS